MRVPLSWLKEYIDIKLPPIEIAKVLTQAGLEVDAIEPIDLPFSNVVVGKVTGTEKHPNADKLCVAAVTDGNEIFQVVCGAQNCRPGLVTAFAKVGATLPDEELKPFKIKRSKIRGVESFGMLCSSKELRLSDEDQGIIELGEEFPIGSDLSVIFSDAIFEISLTPNLSHCNSILGVARELHAKTEAPLSQPSFTMLREMPDGELHAQAAVKVENSKLCPRYACRLIKNISIAPSPQWMQNRLRASGIRPINNIVDITNYVLLEMGHPLHAFDYGRIEGGKIVVRNAQQRESFVTLDGIERTLHSDDILICDAAKPIALGGIMGGSNSEISPETTDVLLESAYFNASAIRSTSKRLGLSTDASKRFERGTDPNGVLKALNRAAMLMEQIAGGKVAKGIIDAKTGSFPKLTVPCRVSRSNKIIGTQLGIGEIEDIFKRLGFKYTFNGDDSFDVEVPTYRNDISTEIDLIEEIARIYGYDNLCTPASPFQSSKLPHSEVYLFENEIRSRMLAEGLQEFLTCDLIGPKILEIADGPIRSEKGLIHVLNPTSIEQSCLRTSLLPGLLQVVKYNYDHQNQNISGFEVGRIHFEDEGKYREQTILGIVLTGMDRPHHWQNKPEEVNFYGMKGIIENLLHELGIDASQYKNTGLSYFHTGRQASVFVDGLELGSFGEIHPSILRRLDVPQRILFGEFNLHDLYTLRRSDAEMVPIARFPCSERDWTITIKEKVLIDQLFTLIRAVESPLLEEVSLLDIYRSEKLGPGIKNVTIRFRYRDNHKTISLETVDREHARITDKVRSLLMS